MRPTYTRLTRLVRLVCPRHKQAHPQAHTPTPHRLANTLIGFQGYQQLQHWVRDPPQLLGQGLRRRLVSAAEVTPQDYWQANVARWQLEQTSESKHPPRDPDAADLQPPPSPMAARQRRCGFRRAGSMRTGAKRRPSVRIAALIAQQQRLWKDVVARARIRAD